MNANRFDLLAVLFGKTPRPVAALGFAGLIPFVALGVMLVMASVELATRFEELLITYAAIILSFMGGCRWGFASAGLGEGSTVRQLAISIIPALYAWVVSLLDFEVAALALAVGFLALFISDQALARAGGAPVWWPALRMPLTIGAAASLVVVSIA